MSNVYQIKRRALYDLMLPDTNNTLGDGVSASTMMNRAVAVTTCTGVLSTSFARPRQRHWGGFFFVW
ncbi:hypothetical protein, partial [Salmonella enterica]|uniref:hypothetical protein n=1 Tax=Salmonella enterica TaxID=28901 RepID=UPI001EE8B697